MVRRFRTSPPELSVSLRRKVPDRLARSCLSVAYFPITGSFVDLSNVAQLDWTRSRSNDAGFN